MAQVSLVDGVVRLRPSWWEKLIGRLRDLDVPIGSVTDVSHVVDGLRVVSGMRAPGLAVPGAAKVGTWRSSGRKVFVAVRPGAPALTLEMTGCRFDSAIVTFDEATQIARQIRQAAGEHARGRSVSG